MEYTFVLTEEEANLLLTALQELPFKTSNAIIGKIMKQANEQQNSNQSSNAPVEEAAQLAPISQ